MYNLILLLILHFSFTQAQQYQEGDFISVEKQATIYDVCNGDNSYSEYDSWKLADYNGELNGGSYKVLMLDIAATW